jgi:hypothetical protein
MGSTTWLGDLRRVRRVGPSGSPENATGASCWLDSLQLIVESDGLPGACVEALFRNSRPTVLSDRYFEDVWMPHPPAERVRCQRPSQRGLTQVQT